MAFHTNHWLLYNITGGPNLGLAQVNEASRIISEAAHEDANIIFGTAIAFCAYLESTKYLSPTKISVFASLEPFSSIILSIIFLNISFGLFELIGAIIIILAVTILSK